MTKFLSILRRPSSATVTVSALLTLLTTSAAEAGGREFWSSLLVPGWGQLQRGGTTSGARFMAMEAALWSGYFGFKRLGDSRQTNYQTYAAEHAKAQSAGKDGEYFDDLGFYQSRHQHNQIARVDDGPEAVLYPDSPSYFWEWDEDSSRERYRDLRNSGERADRNAVFVTGLVVFNHVAAAIHAARLGSRSGSAQDSPQTELLLGPIDIDRFQVGLVRRF